MTPVSVLNNRLADALGRVKSGTLPRFAWIFSTELRWYYRDELSESFQPVCLADRIGRVWMMCEWRVPRGFDARAGYEYELKPEHWFQMFRGSVPFPAGGEYAPYEETQLAPGQVPTAELTQNYIWAIDKQMSPGYEGHLIARRADLEENRRQFDEAQLDEWLDAAPAFGNYDPGKRGGFLSFGGV